jgi:hypothetical protein
LQAGGHDDDACQPLGLYMVVRLDLWDRFLLDPIGAKPNHFDRRGFRQLRDADSSAQRIAPNGNGLALFSNVSRLPGVLDLPPPPSRRCLRFLICEWFPLIWINAAVMSLEKNSI